MSAGEDNVYLVVTVKRWNVDEFARRVPAFPGRWMLVTDPSALEAGLLRSLRPRFVFFPHWSWKVPDDVLAAAECVCFHMTDVPYGRGGSPLQNLIARGHTETKLSALRMVPELDTGPVYMKRALSLEGTAHEIFQRCASVVFDMIEEMVVHQPEPAPQSGTPVVFARRRPSESRLPLSGPLHSIYDHIRMLDADGYPRAFLDYGDYRLELREARMEDDRIVAYASFTIANEDS